MAGNLKYNLQGKQFNTLLVIRRGPNPKNSYDPKWLCRCTCGVEFLVLGRSLRNGRSNPCRGCKSLNYFLNRKFGYLKVLDARYILSLDRHSLYRPCRCDCGNEVWVNQKSLKFGTTQSCGCLRNEKASDRMSKFNYKHGLSQTKEYRFSFNTLRRKLIDFTDDGTATVKALKQKIKELGNKCVYCQTGKYEHLDHIIPLSRGGKHTLKNIVPACEKCNLNKKDKLLFVEWLPSTNKYGVMNNFTLQIT